MAGSIGYSVADMPEFCSVYDSRGDMVAIGRLEVSEGDNTLTVGRIRPVHRLADLLFRYDQREYRLRVSGGQRFSALLHPSMLDVEQRRGQFLVLGRTHVTRLSVDERPPDAP